VTGELEALKQAIVVLAKYGTVWARVIRNVAPGAEESAALLGRIHPRAATS
jgi:hypothetical protein